MKCPKLIKIRLIIIIVGSSPRCALDDIKRNNFKSATIALTVLLLFNLGHPPKARLCKFIASKAWVSPHSRRGQRVLCSSAIFASSEPSSGGSPTASGKYSPNSVMLQPP